MMATETAPTLVPSTSRPLWQVPTFIVGILSLLAMWHYGDRMRPTVAERYYRSMAQLRQALDRLPPDIDQIQSALRKIPPAEPTQEQAGQVHFLTGSAYVALAEATTSANEASECWAKAKVSFDKITDLKQIPDTDQRRFRYRRARMWANTNSQDPQQIINALTETITSGDDLAEGYRLLADLHTKLPTPDDAAIRDNLRNFLKHASTRADSRTLNQARVRLAELHAKLNEPEDARKVVERVGPDAPPELYAAARLLAAKFHLDDEQWQEAAKAGEQVRDMNGATDAQKAQALIQLAEAYQRLNRPNDAKRAVTDGVSRGGDSRLTAVKMAALHLGEQTFNLEEAIRDLENAVKGIRQPQDWPNEQLPATEIRKCCMEAYNKAVAEQHWTLALRAAKVLTTVTSDSDGRQLLAKAHEQMAERLAADPLHTDDVRQHYREAAEQYVALGKMATNNTAKGELFRKGARLHNQGDDRAKAIAVLNEVVMKASDYPEAQANGAWSELGDTYYQAKDKKNALLAYENAASRVGPTQMHAKVRYAGLIADDPAKIATAISMLEEVLAVPDVLQKHKSVHEECLYLLGELLTRNKEWQKAEPRLRSALTAYPDSPQAVKGRLQFGQCFRHRANLEARKIETDRAIMSEIKNERLQMRQPSRRVDEQIKIEDRISQAWKNYDEYLKQAFEAIRQAEEQLASKPLPDPDYPELLRRASFYAADCANWLGMYEDCANRYAKLVQRYRSKAEELEALRDLHRCCSFAIAAAKEAKNANDAERWGIKQTLVYKQLQEAYTRVPDSEMDGSFDVKKRAYWDKWLKEHGPKASVQE